MNHKRNEFTLRDCKVAWAVHAHISKIYEFFKEYINYDFLCAYFLIYKKERLIYMINFVFWP